MKTKETTDHGEMKVQAIQNGTVIDHIPSRYTLQVVRLLSGLDDFVTIGINFPSGSMERKGVVKIANKVLTQNEVNKIAIFAPQATVNIIKNFQVVDKRKVKLPKSLQGIVKCSNPKCITNAERMPTVFYTSSGDHVELRCHYCERIMPLEEVEVTG